MQFLESTPLHESFLASQSAGAVRALYIAQDGDYAAGVWTDRSGIGNDTAQVTGTKQPAFNATGINSLPSVDFDGGDCLQVTLDLSAYRSVACMALFQDTDTAVRVIAEHGASIAGGPGFLFAVNATTGTTVEWWHNTGVGITKAQSSTGLAMTSPAVVTGYGDIGLATDEAEIRHDLANVTAARPANINNTANFGNLTLNIGARNNAASLGLVGKIAFFSVLGWTDAASGHVAEMAAGEALVKAAWGL